MVSSKLSRTQHGTGLIPRRGNHRGHTLPAMFSSVGECTSPAGCHTPLREGVEVKKLYRHWFGRSEIEGIVEMQAMHNIRENEVVNLMLDVLPLTPIDRKQRFWLRVLQHIARFSLTDMEVVNRRFGDEHTNREILGRHKKPERQERTDGETEEDSEGHTPKPEGRAR